SVPPLLVLQYEDAYVARKLQNWNLPRVFKEHPSAHEGYTQFIANDRGHLLPSVPRSKASPWGTYLGTWDMPLKIPPAKVNLTSRSVDAAAHLIEWIGKSTALDTACNGFRPQVIGKVKRIQRATSPLPNSHPNQKNIPDRPSSRESALRRAASAEASPAGWPKSLEGKSKGVSTPELLASYRTGSMEANPRRARSPEAPPSSRPATKASQALETQKGLVEPEMDRRERGGLARPLSCPEEQLS
uniref:Protein Flattop n=1 Tax=Varanus komodoensis TaxID=61221 RepID=A0A8D2J6A2_VARKO